MEGALLLVALGVTSPSGGGASEEDPGLAGGATAPIQP